jgi:hypothetical protein
MSNRFYRLGGVEFLQQGSGPGARLQKKRYVCGVEGGARGKNEPFGIIAVFPDLSIGFTDASEVAADLFVSWLTSFQDTKSADSSERQYVL